MEVVAVVSSIAGIASLVGQSLNGLSSLFNFFKDCRDASKTVDQFLRSLTSLESTIKNVENLVTSVKNISDTSAECTLASLAIHVEDCTKDIDRWLKEAQPCYPGNGPGTKSMFKNFLVAVRKQSIKDILQDMAAHKESISLSLSTTGRLLDIQHLKKVNVLHDKVDEIAEYEKVTVEALGRLETRFQQSDSFDFEALDTSRSLNSIASHLSRIESLLSVGACTDSSNFAPKSIRHSQRGRTGSISSLHTTYSASPLVMSEGRRNSTPSSSIGASKNMFHFEVCAQPHAQSATPKLQTDKVLRLAHYFYDSRYFIGWNLLSENEFTKQHRCQFCGANFNAIPDYIHEHDKAWSCSMLMYPTLAFYDSREGPSVTCSFCGDIVFSTLDHLISVHRFAECDPAIYFKQKHLFHTHLRSAHAAKIGSWTEKLDTACCCRIATSVQDIESDADPEQTLSQPISAYGDSARGYVASKNDTVASILSKAPKVPEEIAAFDISHASEGLIPYINESFSTNLAEYIQNHQMAETTQAQIRILSALTLHLNLAEPTVGSLKLQEAQENSFRRLQTVATRRDEFREACWREGYNVDELDRTLMASVPQYTTSNMTSDIHLQPASEQQRMSWWDVLHHTSSQNWLTKKDRINSWLLQNLAAQPSEVVQHRKFLQDWLQRRISSEELSEEEWARLVLKFWAIDDAARPCEHIECSTNGAVDSDGACHSARVKLGETLLLPIRGEDQKLDVVEMEIDLDEEDKAIMLVGSKKRKRILADK